MCPDCIVMSRVKQTNREHIILNAKNVYEHSAHLHIRACMKSKNILCACAFVRWLFVFFQRYDHFQWFNTQVCGHVQTFSAIFSWMCVCMHTCMYRIRIHAYAHTHIRIFVMPCIVADGTARYIKTCLLGQVERNHFVVSPHLAFVFNKSLLQYRRNVPFHDMIHSMCSKRLTRKATCHEHKLQENESPISEAQIAHKHPTARKLIYIWPICHHMLPKNVLPMPSQANSLFDGTVNKDSASTSSPQLPWARSQAWFSQFCHLSINLRRQTWNETYVCMLVCMYVYMQASTDALATGHWKSFKQLWRHSTFSCTCSCTHSPLCARHDMYMQLAHMHMNVLV